MPNQDNIESPITLISFGRSGTSLLSNIFNLHPQCRSINETVNLIFGIWHAVELAIPVTDPLLIENGAIISDEERAGRAVRQTFLTCFPDDQPYWFQKPIAPPKALSDKFADGFDESRWAEAAEWYWKVMAHSFPKAKYFTILRHPCDVVLSAQAYWGVNAIDIWPQLGLMAYFLTHPASPVQYAIHFEELVQHKEKVIRDLFAFFELPFDNQVLEAFSQPYGASKRKGDSPLNLSIYRDEWDQLDSSNVTPLQLKYLGDLFDKFGYSFELPAKFNEDNLASSQLDAEKPEETIPRLYQEIRAIHTKHAAELINLAQQQEAQAQQQEAHNQQREAHIQQLETHIQQQEAHIRQQEAYIQSLEQRLEAIEKTKVWQLALKWYGLKHFLGRSNQNP